MKQKKKRIEQTSQKNKFLIMSLLAIGEANKIQAVSLAHRIGTTTKHIYAMARYEREHGAPIISTKHNGGGYYLASDALELRAFKARWIESNRRSTMCIKACDNILDNGNINITMDDYNRLMDQLNKNVEKLERKSARPARACEGKAVKKKNARKKGNSNGIK